MGYFVYLFIVIKFQVNPSEFGEDQKLACQQPLTKYFVLLFLEEDSLEYNCQKDNKDGEQVSYSEKYMKLLP